MEPMHRALYPLTSHTLTHIPCFFSPVESITKNNVSVMLPAGTYRIMVEATTASVVASYIALTTGNVEPGRCAGTNNTCARDEFT